MIDWRRCTVGICIKCNAQWWELYLPCTSWPGPRAWQYQICRREHEQWDCLLSDLHMSNIFVQMWRFYILWIPQFFVVLLTLWGFLNYNGNLNYWILDLYMWRTNSLSVLNPMFALELKAKVQIYSTYILLLESVNYEFFMASCSLFSTINVASGAQQKVIWRQYNTLEWI